MTSKPKKPSDVAVPVSRKGERVDPGEPNDGYVIRDEVKYARRLEQERRERRVAERRKVERRTPIEVIEPPHPSNGVSQGENGEHGGGEAA